MFSTKKYFLIAPVTSYFSRTYAHESFSRKRGFENKIKIHLFRIEKLFLKISN